MTCSTPSLLVILTCGLIACAQPAAFASAGTPDAAHRVAAIHRVAAMSTVASMSESSPDAGPGDDPDADGPDSDPDDDAPPCDYVGEAFTRDCTITPDTPVNQPADAPDECNLFNYDDFWGALYGCG